MPSPSFPSAFILLDSMDESSTLTGTTTLPDDVTTLPDDVTVPYLRLGLDSYQTVLEKYGLNIIEDNPWKALEGFPIDPDVGDD
jgi:hypothetical protein